MHNVIIIVTVNKNCSEKKTTVRTTVKSTQAETLQTVIYSSICSLVYTHLIFQIVWLLMSAALLELF